MYEIACLLFQGEYDNRVAQESRGLGDVDKRQVHCVADILHVCELGHLETPFLISCLRYLIGTPRIFGLAYRCIRVLHGSLELQ